MGVHREKSKSPPKFDAELQKEKPEKGALWGQNKDRWDKRRDQGQQRGRGRGRGDRGRGRGRSDFQREQRAEENRQKKEKEEKIMKEDAYKIPESPDSFDY